MGTIAGNAANIRKGRCSRPPKGNVPFLAALLAACLTTGCGDGAVEPVPPPALVPTAITISPASATFQSLGETVRLAATVQDQNGQTISGATVAWASSDPSVAAVDASGLVTAVANGTASVTATAGSASGSAEVTVDQVLAQVVVEPGVDTLLAFGDTLRLTAEAVDANGSTVAGAELAWASGDTLVAIVDQQGLVTGVSVGETEVTASSADLTGRAQLAVLAPAPTAVAISPDTVGFDALGQTARLAAEVRDQAGRVMEGLAVSWSSGDTLVALVDSAGLVTAAGTGTTTIAATADSASGQAAVTVMQSAGSVVLAPATDTISPGDTLRLGAEAFDGNGHVIEATEFDWSSSDVSVVRVDASGLVTGVSKGWAMVTAVVGDVHGTAEITVENRDRAALVALYNATDGPNWVNSENWLTDEPLGEWHGVDTDAFGRVVRINLSGQWDREAREWVRHGLAGPIPPEIGSLSKLESLWLVANDLKGPIPPELDGLAKLAWLDLTGNDLSGPIPPELGKLHELRGLGLYQNQLSGSIPPELGDLAKLEWLNLGGNDLSGPIPPELGDLAKLESLNLGGNDLSGPIPPELGSLAKLESLNLRWNDLSRPIPTTLLGIGGLRFLAFEANGGLCAPGTVAFAEWLDGIEEHRGPFCNDSDRAVLESLFEAAGGSDWTSSNGWLDGNALAGWHGVRTDSLGRVNGLDLTGNGLVGRLPATVGELEQMTEVRIGGNAGLSGRLPLSLAKLSLRVFHYPGTGLCVPTETGFKKWLSAIPSHEGTASECLPLSDREGLEALYDATGGPNWTNSRYWMTDAPLRRWHGVSVDGQGRVIRLELAENNLTGTIPPEIGSLANLQTLILADNSLSGSIPPELGSLANLKVLGLWRWAFSSRDSLTGPIPPEIGNLVELERLDLGGHGLSGSIPPELGNLANLRWLSLLRNDLSGPIPSELGSLPNILEIGLGANRLSGPIPPHLGRPTELRHLALGDNGLSGPIPRELGDLKNLASLLLQDNDLSGSIPSDLGDLTRLRQLYLDHNRLTGTVPPEFGGLQSLTALGLSGNAGLSGALPTALTALQALEALQAGGTDLCVPVGPRFRDWIETIHKRRIAPCSGEGVALAYLTQAVQSREYPVPLVAGEEALLRVFVTAAAPTTEELPAVRARFFVDGVERHVASIPARATPIPTEVHEDALSSSVNAEIPGAVVRPGLEVVVEIDPEGTLDPGLGVPRRIPATGRMALDVREMPVLRLTVVPFLWRTDPDRTIVELTAEMAADLDNHELLADTRTLLPVADVAVKAHEPVWSSSNNASDLLGETEAVRVLEGGKGHWMGMMSGNVTGAGGVAKTPGRTNFSQPYSEIIAHELGHNMNLGHAPCGGAGGDPSFPYPDGSIGSWGYDFAAAGGQVHPSTPDLMSYCDPKWISDYHFTNALRYRLFDEGASAAAAGARSAESLLLWGGTDTEREPFLNPAFVVDAPAMLPDSAGEYRIAGHAADGTELFALDFPMSEIADGDGRSSFAFVVPVRPGWADQLATITLAGPGGTATLDGDTDRPMTILRDPATGQVRGILRGPPVAGAQPEAWDEILLDVIYSRGIPDGAAWRR